MLQQIYKGLIGFIAISLISFISVVLYVYNETSLNIDTLIDYNPKLSTTIYDKNNKRIAYVFENEHRIYTTYDEVPAFLLEALIAIEDTSFFEHNGLNMDAIFRAIIKDIKARKFVEGGSTISQQLIKYNLLSHEKSITRKIKEAILALKMELVLSKEEVLEIYLNSISYGNNYFGLKTAADGYFHKRLDELTHKEMALLVGLPNAPSFYNPRKHYTRALNRANSVLYRMMNIGWISREDYLKSIKETPYIFKPSLAKNLDPYIVNLVVKRAKKVLPNIYSDGYSIYLDIDINKKYSFNENIITKVIDRDKKIVNIPK